MEHLSRVCEAIALFIIILLFTRCLSLNEINGSSTDKDIFQVESTLDESTLDESTLDESNIESLPVREFNGTHLWKGEKSEEQTDKINVAEAFDSSNVLDEDCSDESLDMMDIMNDVKVNPIKNKEIIPEPSTEIEYSTSLRAVKKECA